VGAGILFLAKGFQNGGLTASILTFIVVTYFATVCMVGVDVHASSMV